MTPNASGETAGGANNDFPKFSSGDNADKVLSANYQNKLIAGIERANRLTFGPGSDVIQFGPFSLKKKRRTTSGSSLQIVSFTLTSADCSTGTAEAVIRRIQCGETGLTVGDSISLVDDDGCYLLGDNDLLVGRNGKAVKMEGDYDCEWCIISLCCGSLSSC